MLDIVEEIIQKENQNYLKKFGFRLELKEWKKDICLGKGTPRVQDRLNPLVENCDIFLGILWTKFGSPPGTNSGGISYSSGTEEEFYVAYNLDKDLWIFFCDYSVRPSLIDLEQLKKVKEFKEILKRKQVLYKEFSSEEEFRQFFKSNIKMYLSEKYSTKGIEEKKGGPLPTKNDFLKHNRGF